jgi:hypothetical protein
MSNNAQDCQAAPEGHLIRPNMVPGVLCLQTGVLTSPFFGSLGSIDGKLTPWLPLSRNSTPSTSLRSRKESTANYNLTLDADFRVLTSIPNTIDENR